jgi:hypothetical protein
MVPFGGTDPGSNPGRAILILKMIEFLTHHAMAYRLDREIMVESRGLGKFFVQEPQREILREASLKCLEEIGGGRNCCAISYFGPGNLVISDLYGLEGKEVVMESYYLNELRNP